METIVKYNEDALYKLRRRKIALGEMKGEITGYPSIDMPWLKYYSEEQILAPIPNMSALEYLKLLNNNNLNLPAIEFLGKQITYLELFKKINDTTKSLHALGVKPGEIVTIMLPACPEEVFLFYAIDQIGACANFIFPGTPLTEVEHTMEEFNSTKLVILEDILMQPNNLVNNPKINLITTTLTGKYQIDGNNIYPWSTFDNLKNYVEMPIYKRNQEEPLFIAKTGGSTGKPKAVVLADRHFNLQVQQHLNSPINYTSGDRWVRVWPLFSASSAVSSHHLPLCFGMTTIIEPAIDIEKMDDLIINYKPSHLLMISYCIDSLLKSKKIQDLDLSFIKTMGIGGEGVTPEFEEKAQRFMNNHNINSAMMYGYGMTENSSGVTSRFNYDTSKTGSVGVPQINTVVGIFDPETMKELSYGEEGEVCILSSTHMLGYYGDDALTKSILKKHEDGNVWLHSGDLGFMDEDGHLFIQGRTKRMIMLFSGDKIYPKDIEDLIETIDEVDRAVVVPEPDPDHENNVVPCVFVTLNQKIDESLLSKKIQEILGGNLSSNIKLNHIYIREVLPQTAIGKVDLKQLEAETKKMCKKRN